MNCGCGEYGERHKPSDITMEDIAKAAEGQGMDMKETLANMRESLQGAAKASERPLASRLGASTLSPWQRGVHLLHPYRLGACENERPSSSRP